MCATVVVIPSIVCCTDTDPVKAEEPEGEKRLGVKEKKERRSRKGRRSTGIVLPGEEVTQHTHTHVLARTHTHTLTKRLRVQFNQKLVQSVLT